MNEPKKEESKEREKERKEMSYLFEQRSTCAPNGSSHRPFTVRPLSFVLPYNYTRQVVYRSEHALQKRASQITKTTQAKTKRDAQ
jgi:hypothetical protein